MKKTTYISITDICDGYKLERHYINTLNDYGLLHIKASEEDDAISSLELVKLEKIIRFQKDLDINLEGIQVIMNLLEKMEEMKQEMRGLQRRVDIVEKFHFE